MTLTIRRAVPADAAALSNLARTSFAETFGHLYEPEDLAAFLQGHREAEWLSQLSDPALTVWLAEEDGVPAAFAKVGPVSLPVTPDGPAAELRQLYILKPWQGSGIAAELMDRVIGEARARGAAALFLSVFIDNHRARRFYDRYGFEPVGRYDFRVGNQVDHDILMRLRLEP